MEYIYGVHGTFDKERMKKLINLCSELTYAENLTYSEAQSMLAACNASGAAEYISFYMSSDKNKNGYWSVVGNVKALSAAFLSCPEKFIIERVKNSNSSSAADNLLNDGWKNE